MPIHIVHTALVDEQHLFRSALPTFFVGTVRPPRSVSPPQYTSYSTIDNDVVSGYSWSMRRFGGRYSLTQLHARAMRRLAASWRLFRITRATALSNLWEDREIPSLHPGINFHEIHHPPGSRASEPFVSKLLSTIYIRNLAQCIPLHSFNTRSEKHRPTCNTNASKQEANKVLFFCNSPSNCNCLDIPTEGTEDPVTLTEIPYPISSHTYVSGRAYLSRTYEKLCSY